MKISSHGKSDRGKIRSENEDAFLAENASGIFAVADGLGGLAAGRQASRIAIGTLQQFARDGRLNDDANLLELFREAHASVKDLGEREGAGIGSGTTCTLTVIDPGSGQAHFAHIGDSAAFLLREGELRKLTIDHTQAEEMRRLYPNRPIPETFEHTLTRCMGQSGSIKPDFFSTVLQPGDKLVLCTDGATRPVAHDEMAEMLQEAETPNDFVNRLVEIVLERGAPDNVTAVAVFVAS